MQTCSACGASNQDAAKFCSRCGQSLTDTLRIGATLQGRYLVTRLLGKGGMGAVYQAQDLRLGNRLVAVKENLDTSNEAKAQFQLEATVLANLNHTNLPRVSDHFIEPSGKQYLVMDFVAGQDWQEMLQAQGCLSESQILPLFEQVCGAVEYLHSQNPPVIHRDIKPANVRVTPEGKAMLVDLGIAKRYQQGQQTMAAARAVTSGFSPPEQYGGSRTDARSDIYALGATLYCLLTGQVPPDALDRIGGVALTPPRQFDPAISQTTEEVILRAMQLAPADRPQTVQELRQSLSKQPVGYGMTVVPSPVVASAQPAAWPAPTPWPGIKAAPYEFASFARRAVAFVIDYIIILLLAYIPSMSLAGGSSDAASCASYLFLIIACAYSTYFHARSGQTLGKKLMRIQVVAVNGSPPTLTKSLVRAVGYLVSALVVYLGFLWMLWDPNRQCLHDKIAGTYVIQL